MSRPAVPQYFPFGGSCGAALVVALTAFALAATAWSQPLPAPVEKAIFGADQFAQPIAISVPYVTEKKQLDAFRNARPKARQAPESGLSSRVTKCRCLEQTHEAPFGTPASCVQLVLFAAISSSPRECR